MYLITDTYLNQFYYIRYKKNTCLLIYTKYVKYNRYLYSKNTEIRDHIDNLIVLTYDTYDVRRIKCQTRTKNFYRTFIKDNDMFYVKELK